MYSVKTYLNVLANVKIACHILYPKTYLITINNKKNSKLIKLRIKNVCCLLLALLDI